MCVNFDDFTRAGEEDFVKRIVKGISYKFTVSKVEEDEFRFTGLDVKAKNGKIEVSMEDYASSVEPIEEIRKAERTEKLTKLELKEYRKYIGKISWLAQGTRPDLSYSALQLAKKNNSATIADLRNVNKIVEKIKKEEKTENLTRLELVEYRKYTGKISWLAQGKRPDLSYSALQLAKKNNSATIADLRNVNKVVEKIKKEDNKVVYSKVGEKEKLQLLGIVDAS